MKFRKFLASMAFVAVLGVSLAAHAGGDELGVKKRKIQNLDTLAAGSVATGDYVPVYDVSADKTVKVAAENMLRGDATTTEIDRVADVSARLVTLGASESITVAAHDGKTLCFGSAAGTATLPAATGSGAIFKLTACAIPPTNGYVITVTGDDTIDGQVTSTQDSGDTVVGWETAANTDTITFTSSTKMGASIGAWVELQDTAADQYTVRGQGVSTGSEATPFSGS